MAPMLEDEIMHDTEKMNSKVVGLARESRYMILLSSLSVLKVQRLKQLQITVCPSLFPDR